MLEIVKLDVVDLALAVGLMAVAVGLSAIEGLGLELSLVLATGRTILQLAVVGYVLAFVWALNSLVVVLGAVVVMVTVAAIATRNRISKKIPLLLPIVWGTLFITTAVTLIYINFLIIQPTPWYAPQYLIPLVAIALGQAMNSAAVVGERFVNTINSSPIEIETHLSLGATPQQAITQYRQDAIKAGLIPTINQMMITGLVTIPSFMSGQLLGNVNPLDAASYQILIMFIVAFVNLVATLLITQGLSRQFFNSAAQLIK